MFLFSFVFSVLLPVFFFFGVQLSSHYRSPSCPRVFPDVVFVCPSLMCFTCVHVSLPPCQFVFALRSKRDSSHPSVCPLVLLTMFFWTLPCLCQAPLCFMLPCCLISCVLNQPSVDAVFFGKPELAIAQVVDLSQCVGIWQAGSRYTLQHFRPMKQKC